MDSKFKHDITGIKKVWRANRCISRRVIVIYCWWIRRFITYANEVGLQWDRELTLDGATRFTRWYTRSRNIGFKAAFGQARSALHAWSEALKAKGRQLPAWRQPPDRLLSLPPLLCEFAAHLREYRGNPEVTIHKRMVCTTAFLAFLRARGRCVSDLRLSDLDAYVMKCRERYALATVADICSMLRSFARFLRATGRLSVDLASSVAGPTVRKGARPYRALPWRDVRRILRAIDRSTPCGRRDYALLLLMSTYGLGAGEVIGLTLDDIDWRASTLHVIRPKTRVEFMLPLLPGVARVLVDYLRRGRPANTTTRHVFVRMRVPHKALAGSTAVRHVLMKHARVAGVSAPYLGSHVLRHTHACRQMDLGTPPKLIGDILGHRDPDSTSAYLRVATERLRQIALPVPR